MSWLSLPREVREIILKDVNLPYTVSICLRGHQEARKIHFQSIVVICDYSYIKRLVGFLKLYEIGHLVQCINIHNTACYEKLYTMIMPKLFKLCPNTIHLKGDVHPDFPWYVLFEAYNFCKKVEYLPRPNSKNEAYVKCAIQFRQLREITLPSNLSVKKANQTLDKLKEFTQLQTIHIQHVFPDTTLNNLIRERDYLDHVEIKNHNPKPRRMVFLWDRDYQWSDEE